MRLELNSKKQTAKTNCVEVTQYSVKQVVDHWKNQTGSKRITSDRWKWN